MVKHESGLTCIHTSEGLCPACQDDYREDPSAWLEYGNHPAGEAAWQSLQREMDEEAAKAAGVLARPVDEDMPF